MSSKDTAWFSSWFDSPYYHVLYHTRDDEEARFFLDNLHNSLRLPANAKILDLACGKGRHAKYLSQLGYDVLGIDLSYQSIREAKQYEHNLLHFQQADMRSVSFSRQFDLVLNLFTSFGYFERPDENDLVLHNIFNALTNRGLFVLDYLNPTYVLDHLVISEVKTIDRITFNIQRFVENDFLIKEIVVTDQSHVYTYLEKVKLLSPEEFSSLFKAQDFAIVDCYGNYALEEFDGRQSPRQIFLLKKLL